MQKEPLIVIAGPTAVGKSRIAIALAKEIQGSIISADSMQIYRGMDIGTAKTLPGEQEGIPHYLLSCLDPREPFHAAAWQEMALSAIQDIRKAGRIPIVAGGTGFYIDALLYGTDFSEGPENPKRRQQLETIWEKEGPEELHTRLTAVDPVSAAAIHPHNKKRIIRALEFYEETGTPISVHNEKERGKESPYAYLYFVLTRNRADLYAAIDRRVDQMMADGLPDEVRRLKEMGCTAEMTSMQAIGYRELLAWLSDPQLPLKDAAEQIRTNTRHYAKRQLTWFRREKDAIWLDRDRFADEEALLREMLRYWHELEMERNEQK